MKDKELRFLHELRNNSRKNLTRISSEINVPVSTLFEMLGRLESSVIKKHVSLVDFPKLGYNLKVHFALRAKKKKELEEFLLRSQYVNSLSSLISGYDLYAECIFKDLKEMTEFKDRLHPFDIADMREIFIVDELKREGFKP